jgi:hypothetical protein
MNIDPGSVIASIIVILFMVGSCSILISIIFEKDKIIPNKKQKDQNDIIFNDEAFVIIDE